MAPVAGCFVNQLQTGANNFTFLRAASIFEPRMKHRIFISLLLSFCLSIIGRAGLLHAQKHSCAGVAEQISAPDTVASADYGKPIELFAFCSSVDDEDENDTSEGRETQHTALRGVSAQIAPILLTGHSAVGQTDRCTDHTSSADFISLGVLRI